MNNYEILASAGGAAALLLTLIQVAPVKLDPWSAILRALGKALNADVVERVERIDRDVQSLRYKIDERQALDCRVRIVRFADEIHYGTLHSRDHFNAILYDISVYEAFCHDHPTFPNEVVVMNIEVIKETYKNCLEKHSFL